MRIKELAKLSVVCLSLSACTTVPKDTINEHNQQAWAQYQLRANQIDTWQLRGRLAISIDNAAHYLNFDWKHRADRFLLTVTTPFGQGVFHLESNKKRHLPITLRLSDGKTVYADNAETALAQVTGWSIPVNHLIFWIRGLPHQSDISYQLSHDGRLKFLQENEWHINYTDYFEFASPEKGLPRKIHLNHDKLSLKIIIEHWQKPETTLNTNQLFPSFK